MDSTSAQGLSTAQAQRRLEEQGPNRLPAPPLPGPLRLFLRQFLSPFIYILIIAAAVSFALGQLPSGVFIVAVLIVNAIIGTLQEYSAQKSAAALRNLVRGTTHVIRDGTAQTIDIEALVPGDLILLSSGDKVPADLRLLTAQNLAVDESMLTGESLAVSKNAQAEVADDAPLADRFNQCFAGSIITQGRAQGIVTATGLKTQIGMIAEEVTGQDGATAPLMVRIHRFTYQVAAGILIAISLLSGLMLLKGGYDTQGMLLMGIGLAVSTIPEGLPAALTVALAIGMKRMANRNVIIRKLVAVEALGSCTFICSDKTGTLTVNELTIRRAVLPDGTGFEVTGEGLQIRGEVLGEDAVTRLQTLCTTGVLANESYLDYAGGEWVSDGDIVDVAFLVFAQKLGLSHNDLRQAQQQLDLIPYESERALSGSLNRHLAVDACLYVKGSPEKLLEICTHMDTPAGVVDIDRAHLHSQAEQLAGQGFRVIALAMRSACPTQPALAQLDTLCFLGMVGMIDPVRPEAIPAVEKCRQGGVSVAMVTGDHPATAHAIARTLNLCGPDDPVVTGQALRDATRHSEGAADSLIRSARVFARIEPQQKEQIVNSFMRAGHFVAVTGDGVNDAPAMRVAHAGIAMGKKGTDVARETADLIISDDNFASIVDGIEQGRVVYNNIRKVIALLIATGFSALLLFFFTVLAGLPMPMIAVQLLWLNLVANGLQDVALAFEPGEGGELQRSPRPPAEPIFERHIIEHVLITGTLMGGIAFAVYAGLIHLGYEVGSARNLTLMLMVLFGNVHALNSRSETRSLFQIRFWANPFLMCAIPLAQLVHIGAMYMPGLSDVLELHPISLKEWLLMLGLALSLFVVEELHKCWLRRRTQAAPGVSPHPGTDPG
jgi:Ca2+-transporting ATPase